LVAVHRYKLKDDVRESMYDACQEWTAALCKSGRNFMGGDCPNLADLVSCLAAVCLVYSSRCLFQNVLKLYKEMVKKEMKLECREY